VKRSIVRLTTGRRALDRAFGFVVSFTERSFDPGVKLSNTYLSNLSAVFRDADGIHARIQSASVEADRMRAVEQLSSEPLFRIQADLVREMDAIGNGLQAIGPKICDQEITEATNPTFLKEKVVPRIPAQGGQIIMSVADGSGSSCSKKRALDGNRLPRSAGMRLTPAMGRMVLARLQYLRGDCLTTSGGRNAHRFEHAWGLRERRATSNESLKKVLARAADGC